GVMTSPASFLLALCLWPVAAPAAPELVAIVGLLRGRSSLIQPPSEAPVTVRVFQRLRAGGTLEVAPASELTLVFWNGGRYVLGAGAVATIGPEGLLSVRGPVTT